jgi:hypothetical protein
MFHDFGGMCFFRFNSAIAACMLLIGLTTITHAQSTATLEGTVTDSTGAVIPGATIQARNSSTGEERTVLTDAAGVYVIPSLPLGTYRVSTSASGMQTVAVNNVVLEVGQTANQNFTLRVAASSEVVEVAGIALAITAEALATNAVIDAQTVQEIPLNGRHFLDMGFLTPGSVTPPANAGLAAPLRGQGFFSFNSAGAREDEVNFMMNGINLSDPNNNQITFQPTIATVSEFKVDNSTYSAEYGRNSGAIVNIATRSGTNEFHGEAYEYFRNHALDARNWANPIGVTQSPFHRNQFGGDAGGPIKKDKTFFYLSYEGVRHLQGVPLSTVVLSPAQRTQAQATGDSIIQKLLPLIPQPNSPGNIYVSSASAPVNIDQGTVNVSHNFNDANRLNVYYAYQNDLRNEPPPTVNNNIPGYGDTRNGHRQILTINDTQVISNSLVNELRLGFNRIHITFVGLNTLNAADYGISSGVTAPIGLPQITVTGAFAFGGVGGEPNGRGDYSAAVSDTLNWIHGKHSLKFGGDYRRINNNNFTYTPGTFGFTSITAFINDQANAFTSNPSNRASRIYSNSVGAFVQDSYKMFRNFTLQAGLRFDWYGTPTEADNRFVVFDPVADTLVDTGTKGAPGAAYNQTRMFEPRLGFSWDVGGKQTTLLRGAYAIQADQPITGTINGLASNPPFAFPVSFSPTTAVPYVSFTDAFAAASGAVAPISFAHNYKDGYAQAWNFNAQHEIARGFSILAGYFGMKGTDLNLSRNYNQPVKGQRPYPSLSASSPIFPGKALGNITVYESGGSSSYNGLWVTGTKRLSGGLEFQTSYTFSKSIDYNSRNGQALVIQDSYNVRNDRGLSDFDARHRLVYSGLYYLPLHGNRLKDGWELSGILTQQSGSPLNFLTSNRALTGAANVRPSVSGPVQTGFTSSSNGNATYIGYIQNPSVFFDQTIRGGTFGNLGRNAIIGPGFSNVDFALAKNTKLTERMNLQVRADAFDALNHPNFNNPGLTVGSSTFGLISATRFTAGESGSSREMQLSMKLVF